MDPRSPGSRNHGTRAVIWPIAGLCLGVIGPIAAGLSGCSLIVSGNSPDGTGGAAGGGGSGASTVASTVTSSVATAGGGGQSCDGVACDDGNPCTTDRCEAGACAFANAPSGSDCGTTDLCVGARVCDGAGKCVDEKAPPFADADPCTADACDPATGEITRPLISPCFAWSATPIAGAPIPRVRHTAIWTGKRMIVWGGSVAGSPSVTATGAQYEPGTRTWTATTEVSAPPPRHAHRAVWTGTHMIVWGGFGAATHEVTGGIYDPDADQWTEMATADAPQGRTEFSMVWTGTEVVVWGGLRAGATLSDGGRYDPKTNKWSPLPAGGPSARASHTAVWTGARMIVWGGNNLFDWLADGAVLTPSAASWTSATALSGAPPARERHVAVFTEFLPGPSRMLVWGGFDGGTFVSTGGVYDADANSGAGAWKAMPSAGAPAGRAEPAFAWTGAELFVWGGCGGEACKTRFDDGALYRVADDTWRPIPPHPSLEARRGPTAVFTGTEVIVWGGESASGFVNSGAQTAP